MSDKKGIPAWQRQTNNTSAQPTAAQADDASSSAVGRVQKFLQDPAVRDASYEKKRAFLLSKNVSEETIDSVMGLQAPTDTDASMATAQQEAEKPSHATDGSAVAAQQEFDASKAIPRSQALIDPTEFKVRAPSTTRALAPQPRRDVPPIITYPEFLVQPQKPPPLVTVSRLVNATYIAGALTASVYALSKYMIAPMADKLNRARHDLLEHTHDHTTTFNDKLSNLVSTMPPSIKASTTRQPDFADSDLESLSSDPTELFHRDVGTQTSPCLSRRSSLSLDVPISKPDTVPVRQATRLEIIKSHLSEFLEDNENNGTSIQTLQKSISDTRSYLDTLYYTPPAYSYGVDNSLNSSAASKDKQPDAAVVLKAEIRGVKGVLLSAKRFPSVGRVGA
jgi:hypothetical protein